MSEPVQLDAVDRKIMEILRADARRTVRDIARMVSLTSAPVRRRIDRLEAAGVILGYSAVFDRAKMGSALDAVTELRFAGDTNIDHIVAFARTLPEIDEVLTLAGDPDALVRIRVDNVEHLQRVVNQLRSSGAGVIGTKTLLVLASWQRGSAEPGAAGGGDPAESPPSE
jgi:Lrp/AsnC family transcriptional regulator, leucine-responsive regulatory protein